VGGLIWGCFHSNPEFSFQIQTPFLSSVLAAAIYGGLIAQKSILRIQSLPAGLALAALMLFGLKTAVWPLKTVISQV
jgi:putative membrane protein